MWTMFGEVLFSTAPYTALGDSPVFNDSNYWNKLCPTQPEWNKEDRDVKISNECKVKPLWD